MTRAEQTKLEIAKGRALLALDQQAQTIADYLKTSPRPNPQLVHIVEMAEIAGVKING